MSLSSTASSMTSTSKASARQIAWNNKVNQLASQFNSYSGKGARLTILSKCSGEGHTILRDAVARSRANISLNSISGYERFTCYLHNSNSDYFSYQYTEYYVRQERVTVVDGYETETYVDLEEVHIRERTHTETVEHLESRQKSESIYISWYGPYENGDEIMSALITMDHTPYADYYPDYERIKRSNKTPEEVRKEDHKDSRKAFGCIGWTALISLIASLISIVCSLFIPLDYDFWNSKGFLYETYRKIVGPFPEGIFSFESFIVECILLGIAIAFIIIVVLWFDGSCNPRLDSSVMLWLCLSWGIPMIASMISHTLYFTSGDGWAVLLRILKFLAICACLIAPIVIVVTFFVGCIIIIKELVRGNKVTATYDMVVKKGYLADMEKSVKILRGY